MKRWIGPALVSMLLGLTVAHAQQSGGGSSTFLNGPSTISGGTQVASSPALTVSQTWNNAGVTFTGVAINITCTACSSVGGPGAGTDSDILKLSRDGQRQFSISTNGESWFNGAQHLYANNVPQFISNGGYDFQANAGGGAGGNWANNIYFDANANPVVVRMVASGSVPGTNETPDGRTGNFEEWAFRTAAGSFKIEARSGGTGSANMNLILSPKGTGNVQAPSLLTTPTTVASLPACAAGIKGQRQFVTDSNSVVFHATVAGAGANNVSVVCDGTNWYVD